jgi:hypothetical protein
MELLTFLIVILAWCTLGPLVMLLPSRAFRIRMACGRVPTRTQQYLEAAALIAAGPSIWCMWLVAELDAWLERRSAKKAIKEARNV